MSQNRPSLDELGQSVQQRPWNIPIAPRIFPKCAGIDLQLDEVPHGSQRIAEQVTDALGCAEQVAHHRKGTVLDPIEQQGRPADLIYTPMDLGHFQIRIDLVLDAEEL